MPIGPAARSNFRAALRSVLQDDGKGGQVLAVADLQHLLERSAKDAAESSGQEAEEDDEDDQDDEDEANDGHGSATSSNEPLKVNTQALCRMLRGLTRTNGRLERETKEGAADKAAKGEANHLAEQRERAKVQIRRIAARVGLRVEIYEDGASAPAPAAASALAAGPSGPIDLRAKLSSTGPEVDLRAKLSKAAKPSAATSVTATSPAPAPAPAPARAAAAPAPVAAAPAAAAAKAAVGKRPTSPRGAANRLFGAALGGARKSAVASAATPAGAAPPLGDLRTKLSAARAGGAGASAAAVAAESPTSRKRARGSPEGVQSDSPRGAGGADSPTRKRPAKK